MEVLTIIGGCCLLFVIIHSYRTYQHDKEISDEIKKLAEQISKLETEKEEIIRTCDNDVIPEIQISDLEKRAKNLKSCFRCRLYQDKVREMSNNGNV